MSNIIVDPQWLDKVAEFREATSPIPRMVHEEIMKSKLEPGKPKQGPRSLMFDPLSIQFAMGYKDRRYSLTYEVLKRIPQQLSIISAIIQTRCNQVASFAVPFRMSKSLGFAVKHKNPARLTTKGEREYIQSVEKFIYNCGSDKPNPYNPYKRDDFETFLKKIVRDSLMYDQLCSIAGTMIEMADGTLTPIEDIEKGMMVRTHTGELHEVIHPTQRLFSGELIHITIRGQKQSVTSGHPFLVAKKTSLKGNTVELSEPSWVAARDLTTDMYMVYPKLQVIEEELHLPIFNDIPRKFPVGPLTDLVTAVQLHEQTVYQILTGTYSKSEVTTARVLKKAEELGVSYQNKRIHEPTTLFDNEWGFITGLYLAEGDLTTNCVKFTFHIDEQDLVDRVIAFGNKYGITHTRVDYADRDGVSIMLNSTALAQFFLKHCKTGSGNKQIPEFMFKAKRDIRIACLKGYLLGDGCIQHNCITIGTTSRNLFAGLRMLLSAENIYLGESLQDYSAYGWSIQYKGRIGGPEYRHLAELFGFPCTTAIAHRSAIVNGNNLCVKLSKIATETVENLPVYNMEIEKDHSYVANGFISHNCFEVIPDRRGQPYEFVAVDASTVRIAANSLDMDYATAVRFNTALRVGATPSLSVPGIVAPSQGPYKTMQVHNPELEDIPAFIQLVNGQIRNIYTNNEMSFGVRNPRTDIYIQGYGYSELEQLLTIITAHLYAEEYNRRFFMQGSAPKGILNFKGDNLSPDQLEVFRRQWRANLEGVENCLDGSTRIYTKEDGFSTLADICGERAEVPVTVWTGTSWETGLVYKTKEPKILCHTKLDNGLSLSTSPDHKIRVIGESGDPEWKIQSALKVGDTVLVNREDTSAGTQLMCFGKEVTSEFMETLGWLLGDGSVGKRDVRWFYHHEKEQEILAQHLAIIQQYFPKAVKKVHNRTLEEIEHLKEVYGFKTVADSTTSIVLNDTHAVRWLEAHGFFSAGKKCVPSFVFIMPAIHRAAYLRGMFSADGNNAKGRSPAITIASEVIRDQVKQLLMSLGIRCTLSEGKTKTQINGVKRNYIEQASLLRIKDRDSFFDSIGFLQPHKQPKALKKLNESNKMDRVSTSTIKKYLGFCREANNASGGKLLSRRERMDLNSILVGIDGCSRPRLLRYLSLCKISAPAWITQYGTGTVIELTNTGLFVPMFDVSVDHVDHLFVGNNIVCSNSWRTPILQSEQGIDWVPLHVSNQEMEYGQWMEYLLKITCAVFLIDPAELNFDMHGGVQQTPLFESSQEWKLKASRDRGLKPMLRFIAKLINDHVVHKLDSNFTFDFLGLDELTEQEKHELRKEQVTTYMTLNEIRRAEDLPDVPDGDLILNPTYTTAQQQRRQMEQQQQQTNAMQGGPAGGGQPGQPQQPGVPTNQEAKASGPQYADGFTKSIRTNKFLEVSVDGDDWIDLYRGIR